jgi:hypothetical protein
MSLSARGLDVLREDYPQAYESLLSIVKGANQIAATTGVGAVGPSSTPNNSGSLDVIAADGIFDAAIMDPNPQRGEYYFLEYDLTGSFSDAIVVSLGPSRNWRGMLGNQTYFFRWYKQLLGSNVSGYAFFGGMTPAGVAGGGALAGPAPHDTEGSGTSSQPGQGWGAIGANPAQVANL